MVKQWTERSGLRVIAAPQKDTRSITILVLVRVGSRYEKPSLNGVSHFVEHLVFKGTKKRPTTLDISKELDGVGASYNAFTGKDHTGFYIKISSRYTELASDIVSDIVYNAQFPAAELDRERTVIHEEINMYKDNPLMHVPDVMEEALYGKKSYLGQNIAGPKSVISSVSRDDILKFWNTFYQPGNMTLVIAGDTTESKARTLVKKHFAASKRKRGRAKFPKDRAYPKGPRVVAEIRETGQVQMGLGFHAFPHEHRLLPAAQLLHVILGASMSSRLFVEIREKLGLCYMIRTHVNVYEKNGNFVIQSGLDRKRFELALTKIIDELNVLKLNGVTEQELESAKNYVKGKLDLSFEDSEEVAAWYGTQEILLGKTSSPEERVKRIQAVTLKDVHAAAQKMFTTQNAALAVIGPRSVANKASIQRMMRRLSA